jgi:hypothetical protein
MGNYLKKEIICNECQRQNIKPDFFFKEYRYKIKNNQAILIDYLPVIVKIDNYGKILSDKPINMIELDIIRCSCSNNHEVISYNKVPIKQ